MHRERDANTVICCTRTSPWANCSAFFNAGLTITHDAHVHGRTDRANAPTHACMHKMLVCMLAVCKHVEWGDSCMCAGQAHNTQHILLFYYLTLFSYLHHTGLLWPRGSKLGLTLPQWPLLGLAGRDPQGRSTVGTKPHTHTHTHTTAQLTVIWTNGYPSIKLTIPHSIHVSTYTVMWNTYTHWYTHIVILIWCFNLERLIKGLLITIILIFL